MSGYSVNSPVTRRLLGALALSALALGAVGCSKDSTNSTSTNGPSSQIVTSPKGTLVGQIVDNNGNPIAGATVSVPDGAATTAKALHSTHAKDSVPAKLSVTTDAAGQFTIPNVVATNVVNSSTPGGNDTGLGIGQPIPLSVSKDGFLTATVTVSPQAQVVGDTPPFGSTGNPATFFVQGFTASAGVVALPAVTTKVSGTLRNALTGAPLANTTVTLDFRGFTPDQPTGAGVTVIYGTALLAQTTDASGNFTFPAVADDSCYDIEVATYFLAAPTAPFTGCPGTTAGGFTFTTNVESNHTVALNEIDATPSANADTKPPYVSNVESLLTPKTVSPGVFASTVDGVTNPIVIDLSEPLNSASRAVVNVTVPSGPTCASTSTVLSVASATLDPTGAKLKIKMTNPLPQGALICVYIGESQITDLAGNFLSPTSTPPGAQPAYDGAAGGGQVVLALSTFAPNNTGLLPVTGLAQVLTPINTAGLDFQSTDALASTVPGPVAGLGAGDVLQLNGAFNPQIFADTLAVFWSDPDLFLNGLDKSITGNNFVYADTARVHFVPSNGDDYVVEVMDAGGNFRDACASLFSGNGFEVDPVSGAAVTGTVILPPPFGDGTACGAVIATGSGGVDLALRRLAPNDTVIVVTRGNVGGNPVLDPGAQAQVAVLDKVPPTTGLQELSLLIGESITGTGASSGRGSGGGIVVPPVAGHGAIPVFTVTPQILDVNDSMVGYAGDSLKQSGELGGLSNLGASEGAAIPQPGGTSFAYDATGYDAFKAASSAVVGIAVSEQLSTAAGAQPLPTGAAATTFSSPGALNDLVDETLSATFDGNLFFNHVFDLYTVKVDSVLNLLTDAQNKKILDLTGLTDAFGNKAVATTNAKVALRDFTPPIMTLAFFDGSNFVFRFNKAVKTSTGSIFFTGTCNNTISLPVAFNTGINSGANAASQSADGTTLTIPRTNTAVAGITQSCFDQTAYAESEYTKAALGSLTVLGASDVIAKPTHALVGYDSVNDTADNTDLMPAHGANSWADWATFNLGITAPRFAMADILGPFVVQAAFNPPVCNNFRNGQTSWSCEVIFNQPVYFGKLDGNVGGDFDGDQADTSMNGGVSQAELNAFCAAKFVQTDNANTVKAMPSSCNIVDGSGVVISATGTGAHLGEYIPADLARAHGFVVNFTAAPVVGGGATPDKFRLAPAGGNAAAGSHKTISSALVDPLSYAVSGYGTANIASTGVVVYHDGVNPETAFELLDAFGGP